MAQAWLDIDIGDPGPYHEALDKYKRAEAFMTAVGSQYGWTATSVTELDEEQQSMLLEAYDADPTWASKGEASTSCPAPIHAGRIVVELYESECPKTVANFKALCTGEKGLGKSSKKPLHYKGHRFHRIVTGFCFQGGDVVRGDGSGGDSIYSGTFNDEKKGLTLKHDAVGVLSMANGGKNTNTSQFFFTLAPAPQCDGKHVVFGRVIQGLDILERINQEASSADGTPRIPAKAKAPLAKHLVKEEEDAGSEGPDLGLQQAIGKYAQRSSSQKSRAGELEGSNGRTSGDGSKVVGTASKVPTAGQGPSGSLGRPPLKLQDAADSGGDQSDDEDEKYDMMSRGTLKARSQALVEVIQGTNDVKL